MDVEHFIAEHKPRREAAANCSSSSEQVASASHDI
jgi:hypothetical protein